MFDIYTLLARTLPQPSITTQTGQPDRPCGKKALLIRIFFKFNDSQYVYLCKTYGHTYVKPKHSNPPNLIRRLPI